ncbi:J domain-containing protein [Natronosalvus amylolyticus]|uniref:J domain-containing protein n=1 Tax=Natronosalvus amylolyticus TaxID=2961994 RepID=UPI0020C97989|nr:J domain-containing protein [Natronosalvus amylolyticus]
MLASVLEAIPPAVLAGLALGGLFSCLAAAIFTVGERWFPTQSTPTQERGGYSSEGRRQGEIRSYLQEIGERYIEGYSLEGTTVAFYLPTRDVAVTFDAQDFFHLQQTTDTYVILAEHEMPGVHLGHRLPFEVPEQVHTGPVDVQTRLTRAYRALEVPKTADATEIKTAYRERVKQVHPDHGGDRDSFREVQEAYATVKEHAE